MSKDIELALTKWATPELFENLSMRGPKAEAELRAAMYPLSVGFSHRVFKSDGRYWITPYITVGIGKNTPSDTNKGLEDIRDCKNTISFYCNKWGEVHAIRGEFVKKYSESDFKNFDEMKKKSIEAIATETFELRIPFMQPKTGERQYGFVVTEGSEGNIEKRFNHDYKWCQWKDVTSFVGKN